MLHILRRHPVAMRTMFGDSLALTYAFPPAALAPLLSPGLQLDCYTDPNGRQWAFAAFAVVDARALRPAFLPAVTGGDFVLTGYRIFTKFPTPGGKTMRGLQILRSDTDRRRMVWGGNLLTRYHYRLAKVTHGRDGGRLNVSIDSSDGMADVEMTADVSGLASPALPPGSPFATVADARRFAGPLPYTFSYEPETKTMVVVKAARTEWEPRQIPVQVNQLTFFDQASFIGVKPLLASAFHVSGLEYGWASGSRRALDGSLL